MRITPTTTGFFVSHTTREVWGVDDPSETPAAHPPQPPTATTDDDGFIRLRTRRRTLDRHQARRLKQQAQA